MGMQVIGADPQAVRGHRRRGPRWRRADRAHPAARAARRRGLRAVPRDRAHGPRVLHEHHDRRRLGGRPADDRRHLALYNNAPDGGRSLVIDWVGRINIVAGAATGQSQIIGNLGQVARRRRPTRRSTIKKLNGYGGGTERHRGPHDHRRHGAPAATGVAANWFPLGPAIGKPGAVAVGGGHLVRDRRSDHRPARSLLRPAHVLGHRHRHLPGVRRVARTPAEPRLTRGAP
jgi:hypothetical protein